MARPQPGATVDVEVPASSANLGPGFDAVGLALGVLDSYRACVTDEPGIRVDLRGVTGDHDDPARTATPNGAEPGEPDDRIPTDERHLVVATMLRTWRELGVAPPSGLWVQCRNTIPMGRGLGSSAAAIVAGVAAACALSSEPTASGEVDVDLDFVNDLAGAIEGHPDNSSASVFGGATLSITEPRPGRGLPRVTTVSLPLHPGIEPVLFVPTATLPTSTARAVLPAQIPHAQAALNSGRAALLVEALTRRPDLLLPATREWLHQEQRRPALGGAMELVDALRAQGHAAVVSGAGPSVLVLTGEEVEVPADDGIDPARWSRIRPGVPVWGVRLRRARLDTSLGEHTVLP